MGHTPGPWAVQGFSGYTVEAELIGAEGRWVAWTAATYDEAKDRDFVTKEDKANARLIAAAPELLAALKELVHYDAGSSDPEDYGYEVLLRCKAAIAKAEGRSE